MPGPRALMPSPRKTFGAPAIAAHRPSQLLHCCSTWNSCLCLALGNELAMATASAVLTAACGLLTALTGGAGQDLIQALDSKDTRARGPHLHTAQTSCPQSLLCQAPLLSSSPWNRAPSQNHWLLPPLWLERIYCPAPAGADC